MITNISETIPVIFQIAVLAVLLFLSVRLIRESGRSLTGEIDRMNSILNLAGNNNL